MTAAVVLAAGDGSRFVGETPKLLAPFRGRPLWTWAVDAAAEACAAGAVDEVFVVTGAVDLGPALDARPVTVVAAPRWHEGQSRSLAAGVAAAGAAGHDAVVVGLADAPLVPAEAWCRVAAATATPIAVAVLDGVRHPPVRLAAELWPELPAAGDEGARGLLRVRPEAVTEVPCPGHPVDIDTVEELARWS